MVVEKRVRTPWGMSDFANQIIPGVTFYSTPGHGGFKIEAKLNKQIPDLLRKKNGWYEEDCEWAIPAYFLRFDEEHIQEALNTLKSYYPFQVITLLDESVNKEKSWKLRNLIRELKRDGHYTICAYGDWHKKVPKGFVGVTATIGGVRSIYGNRNEKHFLVPADEYQCRTNGEPFKIDPSRHSEWDGP